MFEPYKKLWIALLLLVVLCPLGLIATGTAFGEWGIDQLEEEVGFIPVGLESWADLWQYSLMPDYAFPAAGEDLSTSIGGYIASALLGIVLITASMALFYKVLEE